MEERSRIYKDTAYRLMMDNFYNQSVVCYYYSVLQRMMYLLAETAVEHIPYTVQSPMGEDRHTWLCERIKERISSPRYRSQFVEAFEQLRVKRKEADYDQKYFTKDDCVEVKMLEERVCSLLRYVR